MSPYAKGEAPARDGVASSSSVRIGVVVKMFPRLSETFILNEILELEAQGIRVHIASLRRPDSLADHGDGPLVEAPITYLPQRLSQEPLRIFRANWAVFRRYPRSYWHTLRHVLKGREHSSFKKKLKRFCQTCCLIHEMGDIEHLHAHFATEPTQLATWAQMICKLPFSVTTHAKDLYQADRIGSPFLRRKLTLARFVVANSEHSSNLLRASLDGADAPPVQTIYNGIDLEAFPFRKGDPAEPLILSVGRLVEKKGFSDLLRACRILYERSVPFRCEIIGTGELKDHLKELIANLGLEQQVTLLKSLPHAEVRTHYRKAMVFALPCIVAADGDRDVLPNVLKEAMAVGVPVVTTSMAAIDELIIHGESGLLVPPGDVKGLATSLQMLLSDAATRRRLALKARAVIEERFDRRKNFRKLKELLVKGVAEKTNP
jgi:glycosyltransferase involved in cell wall biosynthesis